LIYLGMVKNLELELCQIGVVPNASRYIYVMRCNVA
jgi:hypothetical protein